MRRYGRAAWILGLAAWAAAYPSMPFPAGKYARNFTLDSSAGARRLRVYSGDDSGRTMASYVLLPAGSKAPTLSPEVRVLRLPLRRVICLAGIHLGFLEGLDLRDRVVGVDKAGFVSDSALRALGKQEKWREVGSESQLDWERAVSLRPDAIFVSGLPAGDSRVAAKAKSLGIPVLVSTEWLENHPLGRAEWIRVYGALFGREAEAWAVFRGVERAYDSLRALALLRKAPRLSAFGGAPWQGAWHVAGGASYVAQLLRDAGIHYLWEDDKHTGSLPLDLEAVLTKAKETDLWINPGSSHSLSELSGFEARASAFKAFRTGRVYQNDVRLNPEQGNDYWESGPTRPDLILADLIEIADGRLDGKPGRYFRKLPASPPVKP